MQTNSDANFKDQLEKYYKYLYPANLLCSWFGYLKDSNTSNVLLSRREFSMTLQIGEEEIYKRYLSFKSAQDFQKGLIYDVPVKMDIGAIYQETPKKGGTNTPQQKQFVLDLDIDSYDNVRICCKGAELCQKCWKLMRVAAKILYRAMEEDFGFKDMLFVFSGRRGMHLWVCDERARYLADSMRRSLMQYMYLVTGNEQSNSQLADGVSIQKKFFTVDRINNRKEFKDYYRKFEIHPYVSKSIAIIEKAFFPFLQQNQGLFLHPDRMAILQKILSMRSKHLAQNVKERWRKCKDSISIYQCIVEQLQIYQRYPSQYKNNQVRQLDKKDFYQHISFVEEEILLTFMYPRLDVNVSTAKNHLLKCPFSVHPKTKKISVPFDYELVDRFNPQTCVQLPNLLNEASELFQKNNFSFTTAEELCKATKGLSESVNVLQRFVKKTLSNLKKTEEARKLQI